MTQAQHTPGPWVIDTDGDGISNKIITSTHLPDGPDDDVCEVYGGNMDDDATREANARLIAEAPAMLEELRQLEEDWGETFDSDEPMNDGDCCEWLCGFIERARAILARIDGESAR